MTVRPREAADQAAAQAFLARHGGQRWPAGESWSTRWIIRRWSPRPWRAAGRQDSVRAGRRWRQCEILTRQAGQRWRGAGTALTEAVGQLARRRGCARLWVITTNDSVDALRFYRMTIAAEDLPSFC